MPQEVICSQGTCGLAAQAARGNSHGQGTEFLTHQNERGRFVCEEELFKQRKAGGWLLFLPPLLV